MNQQDVADPDETVERGYCALCKSRCGALFTLRDRRIVKVEPDESHPSGDSLCAKGRAAAEIVEHPARLTTPLRRITPKGVLPARWEEISWDKAIAITAERLTAIKQEFGPNAIGLQQTSPSSSPLSDSLDWLLRLYALIGSANLMTNTENCNWHKDVTHMFTFGVSTPTANWLESKAGILWGHNPAKTWLAQASLIARAQTKGMKLVVVDPIRSTSALNADLWLRITPGTDAALALFAIRELIRTKEFDAAFIQQWSNAPFLVNPSTGRFIRPPELLPSADVRDLESGFVVWNEAQGRIEAVDPMTASQHWREWSLDHQPQVIVDGVQIATRTAFSYLAEAAEPWDYATTRARTGIPIEDLRQFVEILASSRPAVSYHAWTGISQHDNATQAERSIACLYALLGSFDRKGGNVQLPSLPVRSPVLSPPDQSLRSGLGMRDHPLGPGMRGRITGKEFQDAVIDGIPYPVKALLAFGGNPVLTQPNSDRIAEALSTLDFYVHIDLFHNPSNEYADILLPAATMYETDAVKTGWELTQEGAERLQYRPQLVPRCGNAKSDTEIAFALAKAMGYDDDEYFSLDIDSARQRVLEPLGVTLDGLKAQRFIRIPLSNNYEKYTTTGFATPSRRVELYSERLHNAGYQPIPTFTVAEAKDDAFPYLLTCAKNGYYCHSQHRGVNSLRKRAREPLVFVPPAIARHHSLLTGDLAEIRTAANRVHLTVSIDESLAENVVLAEFGWWEKNLDLGLPGYDASTAAGSNFNRLVSGQISDPVSGSSPFRSTRCAISALPKKWPVPSWRSFTVMDVIQRTEDIKTVVLKPSDGTFLSDFLPGQHLEIRLLSRNEQPRQYSLTSQALRAEGHYEIAVKRVDAGSVSPLVHELHIDDVVECQAPRGTFTIPYADHPRPLVFIALGVGITPFMSALRTIAHCVEPQRRPKVELFYSARDCQNLAYGEEIAEIAGILGERFRITVYLTQERDYATALGKTFPVTFRRMTSADISAELVNAGARFYYCGSDHAAKSFKEDLFERGVGAHQFFSEFFHTAPLQITRPDSDATITFANSGIEANWSAEQSLTLLEFAEQHGVKAPSGCKLGQCESCATRIISGSVVHLVDVNQDYQNTDECLTCQSLPLGDLTLDL